MYYCNIRFFFIGKILKQCTYCTFTVLDATAKGPEGLLDGNTFSFGNFDQCVSTKSKNLGISGGYSLVDIDYRPTYQVHPGFYHDDHLDDYEPLDDDESAWEAINVIIKHFHKFSKIQRDFYSKKNI